MVTKKWLSQRGCNRAGANCCFTCFSWEKIGTKLIIESLKFVKEYLTHQNSILKAVIVTTRSDNTAQHLYERTLGAKANVIIKDLYSHDEVVMISRFL